MKVLKAYKFRLYPTQQQKEFFIQNFGCARFTYNHLLTERQREYQETGKISNTLTPASLKRTYPFLKQADSLALANAQLNLNRAFKNYFKGRSGFPKLKTKKALWQSYTTNNQQGTIQMTSDDCLKLPKLKSFVKVDAHRVVDGTIKSATISAKGNTIFFVSLLCEEEIAELPKTNQTVGIAFSTTTGLSSSQALETKPVEFAQILQQIASEQKRLKRKAISARRRKVKLADSKNYQKHKMKVSNLYQHYQNQKKDYVEKISHELIRKFDHIFIEAKPVMDAYHFFDYHDWYFLVQKLKYKATWYGKNVYLIDISELDIGPGQRCQQLEQSGKLHLAS